MKWAFRIRRKVSAALLLAAIFVLVFVKNTVENRYVSELGAAFASVYEDRLVVESYIYRLTDNLFRKKIVVDTCNTAVEATQIESRLAELNASIAQLLADYGKTRLTDEETDHFASLKGNIQRIHELEDQLVRDLRAGLPATLSKASLDQEFDEASENLTRLSVIQLSEGKLLSDQSKKIVAGSSLLTQFEMGIIIAIGLMILVLIFESTSSFAASRGKESMN